MNMSTKMTREEFKKTFGERVRTHMCAKKVTQRELAEAVGVTQPALNRYLRGERVPSLQVVRNISNYFGNNVLMTNLVLARINLDKKELPGAEKDISEEFTRTEYRELFAKNLRECMLEKNMSVPELSAKSYISKATIHRYLNAESELSIRAVVNFSLALEVPLRRLGPVVYLKLKTE